MTTETPAVDYRTVIRYDLACEIAELRSRLGEGDQKHLAGGDYSDDNIVPQYATIGSLIRLHKGVPVVEDGEMLGGLPVRIDHYNQRTIAVCADGVLFVHEEGDPDDDAVLSEDGYSDIAPKKSYYKLDLREETTW